MIWLLMCSVTVETLYAWILEVGDMYIIAMAVAGNGQAIRFEYEHSMWWGPLLVNLIGGATATAARSRFFRSLKVSHAGL
jgi:hypothetical protein